MDGLSGIYTIIKDSCIVILILIFSACSSSTENKVNECNYRQFDEIKLQGVDLIRDPQKYRGCYYKVIYNEKQIKYLRINNLYYSHIVIDSGTYINMGDFWYSKKKRKASRSELSVAGLLKISEKFIFNDTILISDQIYYFNKKTGLKGITLMTYNDTVCFSMNDYYLSGNINKRYVLIKKIIKKGEGKASDVSIER